VEVKSDVVDVDHWAEELLTAERDHRAIAPITDKEPDLTLAEAYAIQDRAVQRKVAAGERIVGAKLGLTSVAKQAQMGVDEPVFAFLTDAMALPAEQPVPLNDLIHPRVEPEIVFLLGEHVQGPGATAHDVVAATAAVCCGLEIIDSRFESFRFTLPDVVADNSSAARFVLGTQRVEPAPVDLGLLGVLLEVGPDLVETAAGAACMGHPATAVAALANWLASRGQALEAGWVVLSGGLTSAVPLDAHAPVTATFAHLGCVGVRALN
jgi:2-oxo-3-hexenedioate decarboxylase